MYDLKFTNMRVLTVALFIACFQCTAQSGKSLVTNPLIRHGDSFDLAIDFPDNSNDGRNKKFIEGSLTISADNMSVGKHEIGLISVVIDGKTYSTRPVLVNVFPELPKVREGFWVSILEEDKCIILEQRIPVGVTVERNSKSSVTIGTEVKESVFADLDEEAFLSAGLLLSLNNSISAVGYTHPKDRTTGYSYKTTVYSYEKLEPLKEPVLITAEFYKNLPNGAKLNVIEIK